MQSASQSLGQAWVGAKVAASQGVWIAILKQLALLVEHFLAHRANIPMGHSQFPEISRNLQVEGM